MGTLSRLLDSSGRDVSHPPALDASLSWNAKDMLAQAFTPTGALIAELRHARVEWIEAGGIRLIGMEPIDPGGTRFQLQMWQFKP